MNQHCVRFVPLASAVSKRCRKKKIFHSQFEFFGKLTNCIGRFSSFTEIACAIRNFSIKRHCGNVFTAQSKEFPCANILICSGSSIDKISGEQIGSISFVVDMRRNKDVCKRGRCVPNIGSAFKYVQQFPNQTINCCRIIVIQNVALVIIACSCIDRSLICFVINNECRIFCRNFLFSSNNFRTVIFSKESENLAQDGCILFCDNHKGWHHRNALGLFVDITFFIARCNRLNRRFNLVIGAYTNANCITLPRHISDTF